MSTYFFFTENDIIHTVRSSYIRMIRTKIFDDRIVPVETFRIERTGGPGE